MYKRNLEEEFSSWIERDEVLIITGARQVGKSSFMKHIQSKLSYPTVFYNLEDIELLNLFNETPKNLVKLLGENLNLTEKVYVFIDEIQYLDNPTNFLKYLYDEYKDRIKLIVSGSSAFYIDRNFKDSLAGRKKIFPLYPLNFREFLIFRDEDILADTLNNFQEFSPVSKRKIDEYFEEYATFGWYPKVVLEPNYTIKKELIGEIVNSYIKKDIAESNIEFPKKFFDLYKILSSQTGSLLNVQELSNSLNLSVVAVNNYLYILKKTFHIYEIRPFFRNIRKELTKMPKVYIQDIGIKNHFEKNFNALNDRVDKWAIFESIVFNELKGKYGLDHINFWRTQDKKEIDFIVQKEDLNLAIEVKYRDQKVNFENFLKAYGNFETKVLSRDNYFDIF